MSFPSFVPRLNLSDRRLNEPPAVAFVPRLSKNGRTVAIGRLWAIWILYFFSVK
jgi:hypothetical protein